MCGRFVLNSRPEDVAHVFGVDEQPSLFDPRFNIAPSETVPVVRLGEHGRVLAATRWGLIPHWSRESKAVPNARAETVPRRPGSATPSSGAAA